MKKFLDVLRDILRYPSVIAGGAIVLVLLGVSIYTLIAIPYNEAIRLWRGGEDVWYKNPKTVPPAWINFFRRDKLPESFSLSTKDGSAAKTIGPEVKGTRAVEILFPFDYAYDSFPQEMIVYFKSKYDTKPPFVSMSWLTPDGREIQLGTLAVDQSATYRFSQDTRLQRKLKGLSPEQGIFVNPASLNNAADPNTPGFVKPSPVKGAYRVRVSGVVFDANSELDAEFVMHGQVSGLAGTDHQRRDLMVALLWGTPIALAFGLLAALGTTFTTMAIAAAGAWFGGWVDGIFQRITEVTMVLPLLSILIMVGTFYSRSIWIILGVTILLNIFGPAIKTYRAIFMQVKQSPYIEAARSYGASGFRIVFQYIIPPIIPTVIPTLVTLIPLYVFTEASLAVLGLGDPILPTWGKVIQDAQSSGAPYQGQYYWVLEPAALLMITGLAFAMIGFSLDRVFNPRLRGL